MSLQEDFKTKIAPLLKEQLHLKSVMEVPRVEKVVLNVGVGRFSKEKPYLEAVERTLSRIGGQKSVRTTARIAISNFKIRAGAVVGIMVTLRGLRMYNFLEKLLRVTLPRVRDFRGLTPKAFDGKGNYSMGFKEHLAFPEIRGDEVEHIHGLQVVIHTSARSYEEGMALLQALGFPFAKK